MKKMQSYLTMFYILDACYWKCKESHLGGLLGAMNPELLTSGMPMDECYLNEWTQLNEPESVNSDNIFDRTEGFVDYLIKSYNFNLSKTREIIKSIDHGLVFKAAEKKTEELYKKYQYTD